MQAIGESPAQWARCSLRNHRVSEHVAFRRQRYGPLGDGLGGWTAFDRAIALAWATRPVSQATVVAYKYVVSGVLPADDAALTEIDEALQVAERSSEDIAHPPRRRRPLSGHSRCWPRRSAIEAVATSLGFEGHVRWATRCHDSGHAVARQKP